MEKYELKMNGILKRIFRMNEFVQYMREGIFMFCESVVAAAVLSGLYTVFFKKIPMLFKKNQKSPIEKTDIQDLNGDIYATED